MNHTPVNIYAIEMQHLLNDKNDVRHLFIGICVFTFFFFEHMVLIYQILRKCIQG